MTGNDVIVVVNEIEMGCEEVLNLVEAADPAGALPAELAGQTVTLLGTLAQKAISAFFAASGTPITVESVQALLPNATPLSAPDDAPTTATK